MKIFFWLAKKLLFHYVALLNLGAIVNWYKVAVSNDKRKLIVNYELWVICVREDNDSNV